MVEDVESGIKAAVGKFTKRHREFNSNIHGTNLHLLRFFMVVRFGLMLG